MTIIGLKELSKNVGKIAKRAKAGEKFTVVNRSTPMFDIVAHRADTEADIAKTAEWTTDYVKKHKKAFDELAEK
jgi:antitoxin (DNA-binding transcriptional repressor) of toxin-antitoxin stability system